jgi:outer membrane receptor protein involved in Fe transport
MTITLRSALLGGAVTFLWQTSALAAPSSNDATSVESVVVTATHLNEARTGLETQLGASAYVLDNDALQAAPGGDNSLLNQIALQAPDVAQDSFGQFHVRGEHAGLQYRLNGIILPEGISVFGQTLDPRLISSMQLITGALPAEYGLRTAGIIDLTTKSGVFQPGGSLSFYGGSHGTVEPSFTYGGSSGNFNYFVSGDFLRNDTGIESPDGRANPVHDRTNQVHGFGYFEDLLDADDRVALILGTSNDEFQIPNQVGLEPAGLDGINGLGAGGLLSINGQTAFASENLDERQREITHYGIVSFEHAQGALDFQLSGIARYSSLNFSPDAIGDLLFNGIAQKAYKRDVAYGVQGDSAYRLGDAHTIRAGFYLQTDRAVSLTTSQVLSTDDFGNQTGDIPENIVDNGGKTAWSYSFYVQDQWNLTEAFTVNYGLRYDSFSAFDNENQLSPRVNFVWRLTEGTTLHAGYSRYFSPPPFELVGSETVALFNNTTAAAPLSQNDTPKAERANYFDAGAQQKVGSLTLGIDSYYKISRNLIDEGQFGAPIILTPFNYRKGLQYGVEFTAAYEAGPLTAYANLALQHAMGKDIVSSQFQFDSGDLAYIADHYIHLDHEQAMTASAGASYLWEGTRFSADLLYGTGLRRDGAVPNGDHLPGYVQVNVGVSHEFDLMSAGKMTLRLDIINVFDKIYELRDGTGIGVGAPQFGPRRGFFLGISKTL